MKISDSTPYRFKNTDIQISESVISVDDAYIRINSPTMMQIFIPPAGIDSETKRLATLCHELGHAVSEIMSMPGLRQDPRRYNEPNALYMTQKLLISEEEEAWDNAEKIFKAVKERALTSYKTGIPINELPWELPRD